ncbi:unnamed protein product [Cunninghamella blakesleeana]
MESADSSISTISLNNAQNIPSEIIQYILRFITQPINLLQCALACKSWSFHAMELLWFKPQFNQLAQWKAFCEILSKEPSSSSSSTSSSLSSTKTAPILTFPYASFIRRVNLSSLSTQVTNSQLAAIKACHRLERITLIGCSSITDEGLLELLSLKVGKHIMSIDLSDVTKISDKAIIAIANHCPRLQGLNLSMCKDDHEKCSGVTDAGITTLAKKCRQLRRIKLNNCDKLTESSALALARYCPRLLEIDCPVTDDALIEIFTRLKELREFRLQQCEFISDVAFEPLSGIFDEQLLLPLVNSNDDDTRFLANSYEDQHGNSTKTTTTTTIVEEDENDYTLISTTKSNIATSNNTNNSNNNEINNNNNNNNNTNDNNNVINNNPTINTKLISRSSFQRTLNNAGYYEQLRVLDLTNANYITDEAIRCIVHAAPKIRNLLLNKCKEITDRGVSYICQLERYLHYLHLGHCEKLTDVAIKKLSEKCQRIRYLDLGQCTLLTDESVKNLATLPRLKRIGLVKCFNITDEAIDYLTNQAKIANSLERVHLSYCIKLTVKSIQKLLNFCQRLNHLSLTSVPDFLRPEIQRYRRAPPKSFTPSQQNVFCVFSGNGVNDLRRYLNSVSFNNNNGGNANTNTTNNNNISNPNLDQQQHHHLNRSSHRNQQEHHLRQNGFNSRHPALLQVLATRSTSPTSSTSSSSHHHHNQSTNAHTNGNENRSLSSSFISTSPSTSSTLFYNESNQINANQLTQPGSISIQSIDRELEVDDDESITGDETLLD